MLKTLLIDDEKPCLDRLHFLLEQRCNDTIQIVGQCQTIADSLNAIQTLKPDLVFLDVELKRDGNQTCFDLLGGVVAIDFNVIFVTGHEQYALRAFQVDAIDYLLKPVDADKLVKAVGKVRTRSSEDQTEHQYQLARAVSAQERKIKRIGIPNVNGRTYIDVDTVVYCRSNGGYTEFYGPRLSPDKERLLDTSSESLKEFELALLSSGFCRIHDSHLINLAYLKAYVNGRGGEVEMTDGTKLAVSDKRKAEFKRRTESGIV